MLKTIFGVAVIMVLSVTTHVAAQPIKMTIGQTGINPGTFDRIAETRGIHKLYALPDLGIQWQQNGEWVLKSYLASNRDTVVRVERASSPAQFPAAQTLPVDRRLQSRLRRTRRANSRG